MFNAELTIKQLGHSITRLNAMVGAKNFTKDNKDQWVAFRFSAKAKNKSNYVKIKLNDLDLYDVTFGSIRGMKYSEKEIFVNIYAEDLTTLFENQTGLYLSL